MYNLTRQGTNIPYVKRYDKNRELINPIKGMYSTGKGDRMQRRPFTERFKGNHSGVSISIYKNAKYFRIVQRVNNKNVYHYLIK